ncbi:hypothetical protein NCS55_00332700 [Fusarium keratoplasticum]|nr:hypothetical protein NCS55_00332700 [Fusarium keratoplasticum]
MIVSPAIPSASTPCSMPCSEHRSISDWLQHVDYGLPARETLALHCRLCYSTRTPSRGTQGLFSSRSSAIRAAPPPLLARDRSLRPSLLGPYLQTSSPSFFTPHREDTLRGEAQIPDLAILL